MSEKTTPLKPIDPLKPRIEFTIARLDMQIQRLEKASERFKDRDKSVFARIVQAYSKHDMTRAKVFANELIEIRKMEKMIIRSKHSLGHVVSVLKRLTYLDHITTKLSHTVAVIQTVGSEVQNVFPEAKKELEQIRSLINGIIMDAGEATGAKLDFESANEEAKKILEEAENAAEQKIKEKFPEIPKTLTQGEVKN